MTTTSSASKFVETWRHADPEQSFSMVRHPLLPLTVFPIVFSMTVADAIAEKAFTLQGTGQSLTLEADGAQRSEVVSQIVASLGLQVRGSAVKEGMVSGRFTGDLAHVLKAILPSNGFVIAYSDGRPVAVTFTGRSEGDLAFAVQPPLMPNAVASNNPHAALVPTPVTAAPGQRVPTAHRNPNRDFAASAKPQTPSEFFVDPNDPLHLVPTNGN